MTVGYWETSEKTHHYCMTCPRLVSIIRDCCCTRLLLHRILIPPAFSFHRKRTCACTCSSEDTTSMGWCCCRPVKLHKKATTSPLLGETPRTKQRRAKLYMYKHQKKKKKKTKTKEEKKKTTNKKGEEGFPSCVVWARGQRDPSPPRSGRVSAAAQVRPACGISCAGCCGRDGWWH